MAAGIILAAASLTAGGNEDRYRLPVDPAPARLPARPDSLPEQIVAAVSGFPRQAK